MRVVAEFEFKLRAIVRKRRKWYLAICLPLDLASQGPTKEKALANLRDAVRGFLADCYERGTLENVLQEAGFVSAQEPSRRARQHRGDYWLTVPIALLAREHHAATLQES